MTPRESKYSTAQNFPFLLVWIDKYEQAINQEKKRGGGMRYTAFYSILLKQSTCSTISIRQVPLILAYGLLSKFPRILKTQHWKVCSFVL